MISVQNKKYDCLQDQDDKYTFNEKCLMWNETYCLRRQSRESPKDSDIEKVSLDEYFKSFPH